MVATWPTVAPLATTPPFTVAPANVIDVVAVVEP
jgi:hypothetical protein